MASITFAQALQDLRAILGEHTPVGFDDVELGDWLDQAQRDLSVLTFGYQRRAVFLGTDSPQAFMEGVREYSFSAPVGSTGLGLSDVIRPLHVYLNNDSLPLFSPDMVDHADTRSGGSGTPRYYYWFAGRMGLVPYPSAAFLATSYTFEILYAAYPNTDWTTGQSVLQNDISDLTPYFAFVRAMLSRRKWQDALAVYQNLMQLVVEYRQISLSRAVTTKSALKMPTRNERIDEPSRVVAVAGRRR